MKIRTSKRDSGSIEMWSPPPQSPTIETNQVHIWHACLTVGPNMVQQLRCLLSTEEQATADRFHFEVHRERFTVARAYLRLIVGRYLRTDPAEIELRLGAYGKPELITRDKEASSLKFNVAHSEDWALYAFARGREIGVDLERIRPDLELEDIARRFFSPREVTVLERVRPDMRHRAFFNCWTRKEAFLKAKGIGLSLPLDQFDVTIGPLTPAILLRTRFDESEASRWGLQEVDLGQEYVGAVAVEGTDWRLSCWKLEKI